MRALAKALPWIAITVHSVVVLLMSATVYRLGGEAVMLWGMMVAVDFPISIIIMILEPAFAGNPVVQFGVFPTIGFGVLGGCQYFFIAWIIRGIWLRRYPEKSE